MRHPDDAADVRHRFRRLRIAIPHCDAIDPSRTGFPAASCDIGMRHGPWRLSAR